jgi:exodeoxyribonuclease VII large subunit
LGLRVIDIAGARSAEPVWGVAALVREVADLLTSRFSVCTVRGELSGFSRAASGHCYFNLKDADGGQALVRCAMFRRAASLLAFAPSDGQLVELRGRVGVYEPRGELQVIVEAMRPAGAGALYEQFLRIKAKLEAQGLFDPARKRELPRWPRAIGVVTSLGAAALHDVITALTRRAPHLAVIVYPCLVQGAEAPSAIAAAITSASARAEVDALLVCRGGGSLEDLWAFNDERVVRAIVAASMPVVCGVGHETDVTLADFAADLRAPTPTAGAELIAPTRQFCADRLDAIESVMTRRLHAVLDTQAQRLDRIASRLSRPGQSVRRQTERIALLAHRLSGQVPRAIDAHRAKIERVEASLLHASRRRVVNDARRLDVFEARLRALDPKQVLSRGYAWLSDADGRAVISTRQLAPGARLEAVLNDGSADVTVTAVRGETDR